jgi:4-carboxymuconolactone decarboxylase
MARIATIQKKEDLAPEHQPVYDSIAASRGVVGGPFIGLLHSPELARRTAHLGSYVRFESSLDHKLIELAALATARELECKHEWIAHVNHAQKAGIPVETVRAIHQKKGPEHFSSEDAQVISYV